MTMPVQQTFSHMNLHFDSEVSADDLKCLKLLTGTLFIGRRTDRKLIKQSFRHPVVLAEEEFCEVVSGSIRTTISQSLRPPAKVVLRQFST